MNFRRREMPGMSPDASQLLFAWIYAALEETWADKVLAEIEALPTATACPWCEL